MINSQGIYSKAFIRKDFTQRAQRYKDHKDAK